MFNTDVEILAYFIDDDNYTQNISPGGEFFDMELFTIYVDLIPRITEGPDFTYYLNRIINVMDAMRFLVKRRYQQYQKVSLIASEFAVSEYNLFRSLFDTIEANKLNLQWDKREYLCDHFGDAIIDAFIQIGIPSSEELHAHFMKYLNEYYPDIPLLI